VPDDDRRPTHTLSDLDIKQVGLVKRPANRTRFFLLKSKEDDMPEKVSNVEKFSALLAELQNQDSVSQEMADQLVAFSGPVLELAKQALSNANDGEGNPPAPPQAPDVSQFSEEVKTLLAKQRDEFNEAIEQERKARQLAEEQFAEERRARRLSEFNEIARTQYPDLALEDVDQFASDLMAIHDADQELYGRVTSVLKGVAKKVAGAQKALADAQVFEQFSDGSHTQEPSGDPFLAKVAEIQQAQFGEKDDNEGFSEALQVASQKYPDLARQYERANR